jgi:hypothetical protein
MKEGSLMCCNPGKVNDGGDYDDDDKSVAKLIAGDTTVHRILSNFPCIS